MKKGQKIIMTHPYYTGYKWEYKFVGFVKDEGQGTMMLETLAITTPQGRNNPPIREVITDGRTMVVEEQWFDQKLTGRRIEYN